MRWHQEMRVWVSLYYPGVYSILDALTLCVLLEVENYSSLYVQLNPIYFWKLTYQYVVEDMERCFWAQFGCLFGHLCQLDMFVQVHKTVVNQSFTALSLSPPWDPDCHFQSCFWQQRARQLQASCIVVFHGNDTKSRTSYFAFLLN